MNARLLMPPSKYFTPSSFDGEILVTIESVVFSDVEVEGKPGAAATTERRGALMLKEFPGKPWLCNVTNTKCIIAMFGEEDAEKRWPGKRLALFQERVMSFGEWVPGVRIKGSPDIAKPVSVRLKLRKKREQVLTMAVTSGAGAPAVHHNGNGTTTPVSPNDAMWKDYKAAGQTDTKLYTALRAQVAGARKLVELTAEDVFKFNEALKTHLAALQAPSEDVPPPESVPS